MNQKERTIDSIVFQVCIERTDVNNTINMKRSQNKGTQLQ